MPDVRVNPPAKTAKRPFPTWLAVGVVCVLVAIWLYRDKNKKTDKEAGKQEEDERLEARRQHKKANAAVKRKYEQRQLAIDERAQAAHELAAIENEDPEEVWNQHVAAESGSGESRLEPGVIRAPTIGRPTGGMHHDHESAMVNRRSSYDVQNSAFE
jgi:hypothetical protein